MLLSDPFLLPLVSHHLRFLRIPTTSVIIYSTVNMNREWSDFVKATLFNPFVLFPLLFIITACLAKRAWNSLARPTGYRDGKSVAQIHHNEHRNVDSRITTIPRITVTTASGFEPQHTSALASRCLEQPAPLAGSGRGRQARRTRHPTMSSSAKANPAFDKTPRRLPSTDLLEGQAITKPFEFTFSVAAPPFGGQRRVAGSPVGEIDLSTASGHPSNLEEHTGFGLESLFPNSDEH